MVVVNCLSPTAIMGVPLESIYATVLLILFLSAKELISSTHLEDKVEVLDIVVLPLLVVFVLVVVFKTYIALL